MCGIAGRAGKNVLRYQQIEQITDANGHRGIDSYVTKENYQPCLLLTLAVWMQRCR